jgi:lipopolysaccharide transport system ATP-binding protein
MSDVAIRVDNLSKQYRIGGPQASYKTIRETLVGAARAPFRRLASVARGQSSADTHETLWALKDVSFEVKHGEVLGIIGRNGAGKSTLLKILSRITAPTEGTVDLYGRVGSLLEVGTGFHPELTGRENIYLNGAILGMTRAEIERRFDEIVDFAEIERFLDTPVKHYSSGMYVRLAFSVAAHLEPEILLVDEVLAVGDAGFQKKCLGKMGEVARQGRTVFFVSHNMNAISELCERVLLIEGGRIQLDGAAEGAVAEYLNRQRMEFSGETVTSWDLTQRPRPFFEAIRVNGATLPAEVVALTGHPLRVTMAGDTHGIASRHFRSGIHVATQDGMRIMSYATPWSSLGDDLHINGKVILNCSIDELPLLPGMYYLSIGCMDSQGQMDWLENICQLSVAPDEELASNLIPRYKTHGYYLTNALWELKQDV